MKMPVTTHPHLFVLFVLFHFFYVPASAEAVVTGVAPPPYIMKIKIHSSCEIEDFVATHLCKLCARV